ncbi:nucleolar protein viriato [Brevipalpus obovatus]|uniref:nucleolar protein viriato n=1 Tax=Brevipalpus obovatus TaxID=246614 RepID=UPI003D9DC24E
MGKKKRIPKNQKTKLVFDEKERQDFLLGFQKRKAERKAKIKEKMERRLRAARIKQRKEKREAIKEMYLNRMGDPDLEKILKEDAKTYDLDEQIVTVTPLDPSEIAGELNLSMGTNRALSEKVDETS